MSEDFYCDEALSGRTPVDVVAETDDVLAFRHTRPFWPVHIVVIPKRHVPSLVDLGDTGEILLHKVLAVVRRVADDVVREHGACRVLTNLGRDQDSKHLHFHVNAGEPLRTGPPPRNKPRPPRAGPRADNNVAAVLGRHGLTLEAAQAMSDSELLQLKGIGPFIIRGIRDAGLPPTAGA